MSLPYELGAAGVVVWVDMEETTRTAELEGLVRLHINPRGDSLRVRFYRVVWSARRALVSCGLSRTSIERHALTTMFGLRAQVSTETGPLAQELLRSIANCSTQHCSGHGRCQQLPSLPAFPPVPAPPGCLKSCDATPCGECATGCPPDEKSCKLPSGRVSSRNLCLCNDHHTQCRGNATL